MAICAAAPLAVAAVLEILRETETVSVPDGYRILTGSTLPAYRAMLDSQDAREGAQTTACGPLASGMDQSIACGRVQPDSVQCRTR